MYTNYEILTICQNCHSVKELVHASAIFLMLLEDGVVTQEQRGFIYQRIKIRKRQL